MTTPTDRQTETTAENASLPLWKQGQQVYRQSQEAFQNWVKAHIGKLALSEWQIVLLRILEWEKKITPSQKKQLDQAMSYQDVSRQVLRILLSSQDLALAKEFCSRFQSDLPGEDYFLSTSQIQSVFVQASDDISIQQFSDSVRLREFALELDPYNIEIIFTLLNYNLRIKDEFGTVVYCSSFVAAIEQGKTFSPTLIQKTLKELYLSEQLEAFFILAESYLRTSPHEEREPIQGVLSLIADYFGFPEQVEYYQGKWSYGDFFSGIAQDLTYALSAFLSVANGLTDIGKKFAPHHPIFLQMLSSAASFFGIASEYELMRKNLVAIQAAWTPEHIKAESALDKPDGYMVAFHILFRFTYLINYCLDDIEFVRKIQQQIAPVYRDHIKITKYQNSPVLPMSREELLATLPSPENRPLRVGYLSSTFRRHSVGFLSHQTLSYHHLGSVRTYLYSYDSKAFNDIRSQFEAYAYCFRDLEGLEVPQMIETIRQDNLDILVYMDSLTNQSGCEIIAYRVAPVQISWLGGDSPGFSEMDYCIADPYLLPENAQDIYHERIIRLPTFMAVEQFDVNPIDTQQFRDNLDIPSGSVVYLTAAIGYKRNPECIEWQLEILQQVPNAILVVKGISDTARLIKNFREGAISRGIEDRLRFMAHTAQEESHRGQLCGFDVILDTFPYTGATHTAEALWQGVPVLTRYGQHYFSRMSYTQLVTIGELDACVAESAEDYIQKGIRLGLDADLRRRLRERLQSTRQSAVVWNSFRMNRTLEAVYHRLSSGESVEGEVIEPQSTLALSPLALSKIDLPLCESAADWNQAGLTLYKQGQSNRDVDCRRRAWESALECWRLGLSLSGRHLFCWLNSTFLKLKLGYRAAALREGKELLSLLTVADTALAGWDLALPPSLNNSIEEALIEPSCDSKRLASISPSLSAKSRYLHTLSRWLANHSGPMSQGDVRVLWQLAAQRNPADLEAALICALEKFAESPLQGLQELEGLTDNPHNTLPMQLATDLARHYVGLSLNRGVPQWSELSLAALPDAVVSYAGYRLAIEPELTSFTTRLLLSRGQWLEPEIDFCQRFWQPGMIVLDIGAHIGVYTFLAARCIGSSGTVFAFEPTPATLKHLHKTVRLNQLEDRVAIIPAAVGNEDKEVFLETESIAFFNRVRNDSLSNTPSRSQFSYKGLDVVVPQITLDTWWKGEQQPTVDFIKLDTNSQDIDVLKGGESLLTHCQPVILFDHQNRNGQGSGMEVARHLEKQGYALYGYHPHLPELRPLQSSTCSWGLLNGAFNLIAIPVGRQITLASDLEDVDPT